MNVDKFLVSFGFLFFTKEIFNGKFAVRSCKNYPFDTQTKSNVPKTIMQPRCTSYKHLIYINCKLVTARCCSTERHCHFQYCFTGNLLRSFYTQYTSLFLFYCDLLLLVLLPNISAVRTLIFLRNKIGKGTFQNLIARNSEKNYSIL